MAAEKTMKDEMNDEWIQFSIDSEDIAKTGLEFSRYTAGV